MSKTTTFLISEEKLEFLDKIAEACSISRNRVLSTILDMTMDYFTDNQIILECGDREVKDLRRKKVS